MKDDNDDHSGDPLVRNPDILDASILVVDDMDLMRKIIVAALTPLGYHNIQEAEDGDTALAMIAETMPDLVILDINMPRMSGYDVCRALRSNPRTHALPVLVQSAYEAPEERVQVFQAGATDFVSKPINAAELQARVAMHLENRLLIRDLSAYRKRLASELDLARKMQISLLPEQKMLDALSSNCGVEVKATYRASSELGGDLWGCWLLSDGCFGVCVMDVTGHGVASAMSTFRIHSLTRRYRDLQRDPLAFIEHLNAELVENFPTGQFATMFYGVYDAATQEMAYVGAGSPPPLIAQAGSVTELDSAGIPLGISKKAIYDVKTASIPEGASLLLYSDVLIEVPSSNSANTSASNSNSVNGETSSAEIVGIDGLQDQVTAAMGIGALSLHDALLANFDAVIGNKPLPDDLTLVELQFSGADAAGSSP